MANRVAVLPADHGDSQTQVMSPCLPQLSTVSDQPVSGSVPHVPGTPVPLAVFSGSVSPSQNSNNFIASPVSVVSSRLSDSSLSVLQQFQRHALRAPVLRNFAVSDFRVWHQQFVQFMTRAGAEFVQALQYPAPSGPPTSPAILAAVEQLLLDALQPALTATVNSNAVSVLNSFLMTHNVDPGSSPAKLLSVLALHFRLGQPANLLLLEADVFATRPQPLESVEAYLHRLTDSGQGTVICRIQNVGASLLITCPAAPLSDFFDDDMAVVHLATTNAFRLSPAPPDVPPPSADDVSTLLHARNASATRPVRWTLAEAHANLGHRNPTDILTMSRRGLLPHVTLITTSMPPCVACLQGVADFHTAADRIGHRATRPLERLFLDFFYRGRGGRLRRRECCVVRSRRCHALLVGSCCSHADRVCDVVS